MPENAVPTVLTVDDNDAIRYSLVRYLRRLATVSLKREPEPKR